MKKMLSVLGLVLLLNLVSVQATSPIEPTVEVEITNCENIDDFEDIHIDVLKKPFEGVEPTLYEGVILEDSIYPLMVDGYYSVLSYDHLDGFMGETYSHDCRKVVYVHVDNNEDFYLVVYNAETEEVYLNQKYDGDMLGYTYRYQYFRFVEADLEAETFVINQERHFNILEGIMMTLGVVFVFIANLVLSSLAFFTGSRKNLIKFKIGQLIVLAILYPISIRVGIEHASIWPMLGVILIVYLVSVLVNALLIDRGDIKNKVVSYTLAMLYPLVFNVLIVVFLNQLLRY